MANEKRYVVWIIPTEDATTIRETLEMDSKSGAFDMALREEISEAIEGINEEGFGTLKQIRSALKGKLDTL
jgi:hypothetical protein